ncbi:hypothetical protein DY000_02008263 [Brassica cretica]|uniref:AP2/ERF domain-containing protein n=1 Tax=Brassica cretica TaxID=69181 RepID=A0ABQ7C3T2_BRACR|nr:hypothetical protein DY000_02008263 [Brassica cretica]
MSSRKGSSKRNSSSHSSLGDSSANKVIAPKEEFEVEEEAKDAYYKVRVRGSECSMRRSTEVSGSREVEEHCQRQAELHYRALFRAERRGKRAIVAKMKRWAALFAPEFESFKDAQEFVGDFCECRGSVATLYKSQNEDFSFPAEVAEMSGLMNGCAHAESLVPPIEGRVRQLWDSIEVSEDTAEAGTGVGDEGAGVTDGEVDQPVSSFGISMSGFLDFEL